MVKLKTPEQIELMREAGVIAAQALLKVTEAIKPGVTTLDLDRIAEEEIKAQGAEPAFKKVKGYYHTICSSINDQVVHGIPNDYVIQEGDLVGVDLGAVYKGYFSDTATSVLVGKADPKLRQFLDVGRSTLDKAIDLARVGNTIGDISHCIQTNIEGAGYSVVRELTGHGIGTYLHEDPSVPGLGKKGTGEKIEEGLVIAIEIIYNMGKPKISILDDGWTIVTSDGSHSGLFEHTVAVTKEGPKILTKI